MAFLLCGSAHALLGSRIERTLWDRNDTETAFHHCEPVCAPGKGGGGDPEGMKLWPCLRQKKTTNLNKVSDLCIKNTAVDSSLCFHTIVRIDRLATGTGGHLGYVPRGGMSGFIAVGGVRLSSMYGIMQLKRPKNYPLSKGTSLPPPPNLPQTPCLRVLRCPWENLVRGCNVTYINIHNKDTTI